MTTASTDSRQSDGYGGTRPRRSLEGAGGPTLRGDGGSWMMTAVHAEPSAKRSIARGSTAQAGGGPRIEYGAGYRRRWRSSLRHGEGRRLGKLGGRTGEWKQLGAASSATGT